MKEPVWIDVQDALALHDRLLALHGGAAGKLDEAGYSAFLRDNSTKQKGK